MTDDDRARAIREARETVTRLKDFRPSEPSGPDVLERWSSGVPVSPIPESRSSRQDSPSWAQIRAAIEAAIREERDRMRDVLIELIGEMRQETADDMTIALRTLACEVTDLRAATAELRLSLCDIRSREPIPLPDGFRTGKTN